MSIYPYYIDVPMLVATASALATRLSSGTDAERSAAHDLVTLIRQVTSPRAGDPTWPAGDDAADERREARAHLDLRLAVQTVQLLRSEGRALNSPTVHESADERLDEALVEVVGDLERGYLDRVIDYLEAVNLARKLAETTDEEELAFTTTGEAAFTRRRRQSRKSAAEQLHDLIVGERRRVFVPYVLRGHKAPGLQLVIQIRAYNLRHLSLADLSRMAAHVIGVVVRRVPAGESFNQVGEVGLGLITPKTLTELLARHASVDTVALELGEAFLSGPVVVIAPMIIMA